jgi:hypothetical protein
MESRHECTRILGLAGYRVERLECEADDPRARVRIWIERRGNPRISMRRLWTTDVAGAGRQGADLGRPAVGGAPHHLGLCAAAGPVPGLRHSHGAGRVRRRPRADHAPAAPSHWSGLPIHADVACGRPP